MEQDAHDDAEQEHAFLRHFRFTAIKRGLAAPEIGDGRWEIGGAENIGVRSFIYGSPR